MCLTSGFSCPHADNFPCSVLPFQVFNVLKVSTQSSPVWSPGTVASMVSSPLVRSETDLHGHVKVGFETSPVGAGGLQTASSTSA